MDKNTSTVDRSIRLIVAFAAAYLGYTQTGGWVSIALYVVAIVMALVAATGFCPLYKIFNFKTNK